MNDRLWQRVEVVQATGDVLGNAQLLHDVHVAPEPFVAAETVQLDYLGPVLMQDTEQTPAREKFCDNGKPAGVLKHGRSASFIFSRRVFTSRQAPNSLITYGQSREIRIETWQTETFCGYSSFYQDVTTN